MKRQIFFLLGLFVASATSLSASASIDTCGAVTGIKGVVEILRRQRNEGDDVRHGFVVKRNTEPVECDDVIVTGKESAAKVLLGEVRLSMGADTRVEIASYQKKQAAATVAPKVNLLALSYGKLRALVKPEKDSTAANKTIEKPAEGGVGSRKGADVFRVKTFTALAGVRGTDFYTSYDPNTAVTSQATLEGSVVVRRVTGDPLRGEEVLKEAVEVGPGLQVTVEPTKERLPEKLLQERKDDVKQAQEPKPLVAVPLQEAVKTEIRAVSTLVKNDTEFAAPKAVKLLGSPELWTDKKEAAPDAKDLKNEF